MNLNNFAEEWVNSWNSHNIEHIMSHYADDIEIKTPMIKAATGDNNGILKGKDNVRNYWTKALEKFPDLKFELIEITTGVNCVALFYKSIMNKKAVELMEFNNEGKVSRMTACYT